MPQLKSGHKHVKKDAKRGARNQALKTEIKTLAKKVTVSAISGTEEEHALNVQQFCSRVDKAAKKGALHARTASRKKSRAMTKKARLEKAQVLKETKKKK